MICISQLWLRSVVCITAVKVSLTYMHSYWKCTHLFLSFCWSCMLDCTTHKAVYIYTFYCLGNMLSLCAENIFVFFMLRENAMNSLAFNPLPPKHHMKFYCEQIELGVAPCLMTPGISTCSFLIFLKDLCPQHSTLHNLFGFFLKYPIAHHLEQVTSPLLGKKVFG